MNKKYLTYLFVAASIGLCGCSSDDDFGDNVENPSSVSNYEIKNEDSASDIENLSSCAMTRGITHASDTLSHVGYSTCTKTMSLKCTINSYMASFMGRTSGVYFAKKATVTYKVNYSSDKVLKTVASPNCGFKPLTNDKERGYVKKTEEETYSELVTYCYYIEYDMLGRAVNKWIPCAPDDVVWLYKIK